MKKHPSTWFKCFLTPALSICVGIGLTACSSIPSDRLNTAHPGRVLLYQHQDLRHLLVEQKAIDSLKAKGACLVQSVLMGGPGQVKVVEINVQQSLSIGEVLKKAELSDTKRQVRIVKQSSIHQTQGGADRDRSQFMAVTVEPGDLIVVTIFKD